MAQYRLLFGQHIGKNTDGEKCTYNAGDLVESDTDLVQRFGAGKFQYVGGEKGGPKSGRKGQAGGLTVERGHDIDPGIVNAFPAGQVSEGVQVTGGPSDPASRQAVASSQKELLGQLRSQGAQGKLGVHGGKQEPPPPEEMTKDEEEGGKGQQEGENGNGNGEGEDGGKDESKSKPSQQPQAAKDSTKETVTKDKSQKSKPDFDKMSLNELKKYAEEEEVDIKGAKDRAEVLKVLKGK